MKVQTTFVTKRGWFLRRVATVTCTHKYTPAHSRAQYCWEVKSIVSNLRLLNFWWTLFVTRWCDIHAFRAAAAAASDVFFSLLSHFIINSCSATRGADFPLVMLFFLSSSSFLCLRQVWFLLLLYGCVHCAMLGHKDKTRSKDNNDDKKYSYIRV